MSEAYMLLKWIEKKHIQIISLLSHSTHKLQPLDQSFIGPLKHYFNYEIRSALLHSNGPLTQYEYITQPFGKAYLKVQRAYFRKELSTVGNIF